MGAVATCSHCGSATPSAWPRCGYCGAQQLLGLDGELVGYAPYAGFWRRALAGVLDLVLVAGPFVLAIALLPPEERLDLGGVAILVWPVYVVALTAWSGDTWGKRRFKVHVVADDGRPISHGRASAREGVAKVVELVLFPIGIVGLVAAAFDPRKQALHDKLAGTVAVAGGTRVVPRRLPAPVAAPAVAAPTVAA